MNNMLENTSTKNKTLLFIFIILSLLMSSILLLIYNQQQHRLNDIKEIYLNKITSSYNKNIIIHLKDFYIKKASMLLTNDVVDAVYRKDRNGLSKIIQKEYEKFIQDDKYLRQVHFHLKDGITLYRAHKPKSYGDNIAKLRPMAARVHKEQKVLSGFDSGTNGLSYRIFIPIFKDKLYIGALEVGASATKLLDVVTYFNNIEALIHIKKSNLQHNSNETIYSNIKNKDVLNLIPKDFNFENEFKISFEDKVLFVYQIDMQDFNGKSIGQFLFLNDLSKEYKYFHTTLQQVVLIFFILSIVVLIVINYGFSNIIGTLDKTKRFSDSILNNSAHAIIATDIYGTITLFNKKAQSLLGYSDHELLGQKTPEIFHKKEDVEEKAKKLSKEFNIDIKPSFELFVIKTKMGLSNNDEWVYVSKNKEEISVSLHITALRDHHGNINGYLGIAEDIRNIKKKEKILKEYIKLIDRNIITSSTDLEGNITNVSNAFCDISGYTKEELVGQNHRIVRHSDMKNDLYEDMWKTISNNKVWSGEIKNLKKGGGYYWVHATISPIYDEHERKIGYTAIRQDITNRKEIEIISITDGLTNIYNRRHFDTLFPKVIEMGKRNNELICFLIMDIDHFKQYNDTYGHQMGDDVLIRVAGAIKDNLKREDDYCFRLGGEEFGVLFKINDIKDSVAFAESFRVVIENLKIPHINNSASKFITASMGLVSKKANDIKNIDAIYKQADDLLYTSKEVGRNRVTANEDYEC